MTGPEDERSRRGPAPDTAELARRARELTQFRDAIERLRRERQAAIDEFASLTRRAGDASPASPGSSAYGEVAAAPPEPDVLERTGTSILTAPPAEALDRFAPPERAGAAEAGDTVDLPDGEPPADPLPDAALDFAALTEEDTIIDSAPRRAADRRRTVVFSLLGAGAVGVLAWLLWGPGSPWRAEAPPSAPSAAGGHVADRAADGSPQQAADLAPAHLPGGGRAATPPAAAVRALVVGLVTTRPVWVRADVDGRLSWNRLVPAGEALTLDADVSVRLRIGDAGAVRLTVNGLDRGPAGRDGQVVTASFDAADR